MPRKPDQTSGSVLVTAQPYRAAYMRHFCVYPPLLSQYEIQRGREVKTRCHVELRSIYGLVIPTFTHEDTLQQLYVPAARDFSHFSTCPLVCAFQQAYAPAARVVSRFLTFLLVSTLLQAYAPAARIFPFGFSNQISTVFTSLHSCIEHCWNDLFSDEIIIFFWIINISNISTLNYPTPLCQKLILAYGVCMRQLHWASRKAWCLDNYRCHIR